MSRAAVAEDFGMIVALPRSESTVLSVMARMLQMQIATRQVEDAAERERVRRTYVLRRTGRAKKMQARRRRG